MKRFRKHLISHLVVVMFLIGSSEYANAQSSEAIYAEAFKSYKDGNLEKAESLFRRALEMIDRTRGHELDAAVVLNSLGLLYVAQARYSDAEPLYQRSLKIRERNLGADDINVASSLNNLAYLYNQMGRFSEAAPLFKRSLEIREKRLGLDHIDVALALNNLGYFYQSLGRYNDAEPLYNRSLAIRERRLGNMHPTVAQSLNNLADVKRKQGRDKEADALYKRALLINETALGPDSIEVATNLNNLALLYRANGRLSESEPLYKRSLGIREKRLGADHPDVAQSMNNLAFLYAEQGRSDEAEILFERSLNIREQKLGPDHPYVFQSLHNVANNLFAQGRFAEAYSMVKRTMNEQRSSQDIVYPILRAALQSKVIDDSIALADSYDVVQFSSSSSSSYAVQKLSRRFVGGPELETLIRREQDLSAERQNLDKLLIAAVSKSPNERNQGRENQMRQRIVEIKQDRSSIEDALRLHFTDYVALARPQTLTVSETQNLLSEDEAAIVFDVGEKNSYVWVVTKSDGYWAEVPVTTKMLDEGIKQLRQSLTFNTERPFDAALAYKLFQQTFGPVATRIADKKRLSIVSNGALTSIPFGLLVTSDPRSKPLKEVDWLIKPHSITVLPSIFSLKTMRSQAGVSNAPKPMIAFADPVFSRLAHAKAKAELIAMRSLPSLYQGSQIDVRTLGELLSPLPGTRREVQSVSAALGADSADLNFGLSATETAVKRSKLDQ